eukprot:scaffold19143_cov35-Tisochrysis_lutea.AAC.2
MVDGFPFLVQPLVVFSELVAYFVVVSGRAFVGLFWLVPVLGDVSMYRVRVVWLGLKFSLESGGRILLSFFPHA